MKRRDFLTGLGASLGLIAVEPVRRIWQVGRNAPVGGWAFGEYVGTRFFYHEDILGASHLATERLTREYYDALYPVVSTVTGAELDAYAYRFDGPPFQSAYDDPSRIIYCDDDPTEICYAPVELAKTMEWWDGVKAMRS